MTPPKTQGPETKNLLLALLLATAVMLGWRHFYELPLEKLQATKAEQQAAHPQTPAASPVPAHEEATATDTVAANAPRIRIDTPSLHGTISTVGGRFDDLALAQYKETLDPDSPEVKLLGNAAAKDAYFVELGLLGQGVKLPDATTRWETSDTELAVNKPVTLRWSNGEGLTFERSISVDEHFMLTVKTAVRNEGAGPVTLYPYGLVSRNYKDESKHSIIMHEGPLGVMNDVLQDITYKTLREDGSQKFTQSTGWIGMTDKYWLTAIIPESGKKFDAEYKYFTRGGNDAYQADLRGEPVTIESGASQDITLRLFAGAKVVDRLDQYRDQYHIPLFDRAVDFGSMYFLTRPIFSLLRFFHGIVGNFGVAILLLTCVIKIILFPLANKSMTAMSRMKQLTPKMQEIRERHKDDKMKMNQEIMAMYKREKVNPMAGCLPIVLQIPVFLSLYRVLFVTIEMRHAPFFGWIHDLSVPDPTNVFTLFGLIPWHTPSFLHIGIWPVIMCITMVIQQKLNPKPADEIQAAMIAWMPYIFLFMFASFPAGLVIYWAWNNTLSILQQLYINHRLTKKGLR